MTSVVVEGRVGFYEMFYLGRRGKTALSQPLLEVKIVAVRHV